MKRKKHKVDENDGIIPNSFASNLRSSFTTVLFENNIPLPQRRAGKNRLRFVNTQCFTFYSHNPQNTLQITWRTFTQNNSKQNIHFYFHKSSNVKCKCDVFILSYHVKRITFSANIPTEAQLLSIIENFSTLRLCDHFHVKKHASVLPNSFQKYVDNPDEYNNILVSDQLFYTNSTFKDGNYKLLANVGILDRGFDNTNVSIRIMHCKCPGYYFADENVHKSDECRKLQTILGNSRKLTSGIRFKDTSQYHSFLLGTNSNEDPLVIATKKSLNVHCQPGTTVYKYQLEQQTLLGLPKGQEWEKYPITHSRMLTLLKSGGKTAKRGFVGEKVWDGRKLHHTAIAIAPCDSTLDKKTSVYQFYPGLQLGPVLILLYYLKLYNVIKCFGTIQGDELYCAVGDDDHSMGDVIFTFGRFNVDIFGLMSVCIQYVENLLRDLNLNPTNDKEKDKQKRRGCIQYLLNVKKLKKREGSGLQATEIVHLKIKIVGKFLINGIEQIKRFCIPLFHFHTDGLDASESAAMMFSVFLFLYIKLEEKDLHTNVILQGSVWDGKTGIVGILSKYGRESEFRRSFLYDVPGVPYPIAHASDNGHMTGTVRNTFLKLSYDFEGIKVLILISTEPQYKWKLVTGTMNIVKKLWLMESKNTERISKLTQQSIQLNDSYDKMKHRYANLVYSGMTRNALLFHFLEVIDATVYYIPNNVKKLKAIGYGAIPNSHKERSKWPEYEMKERFWYLEVGLTKSNRNEEEVREMEQELGMSREELVGTIAHIDFFGHFLRRNMGANYEIKDPLCKEMLELEMHMNHLNREESHVQEFLKTIEDKTKRRQSMYYLDKLLVARIEQNKATGVHNIINRLKENIPAKWRDINSTLENENDFGTGRHIGGTNTNIRPIQWMYRVAIIWLKSQNALISSHSQYDSGGSVTNNEVLLDKTITNELKLNKLSFIERRNKIIMEEKVKQFGDIYNDLKNLDGNIENVNDPIEISNVLSRALSKVVRKTRNDKDTLIFVSMLSSGRQGIQWYIPSLNFCQFFIGFYVGVDIACFQRMKAIFSSIHHEMVRSFFFTAIKDNWMNFLNTHSEFTLWDSEKKNAIALNSLRIIVNYIVKIKILADRDGTTSGKRNAPNFRETTRSSKNIPVQESMDLNE